MSFENGKINFGMLIAKSPIPVEFDEELKALAYSEVAPTILHKVTDITKGFSLITDTEGEIDFSFGGLTYGAIRERGYKIDSKLMGEAMKKAIKEASEKMGGAPLAKKQKAEIRDNIVSMMESKAIPYTKGVRFVITPDRRRILVEASNMNKLIEIADFFSNETSLKDLSVYSPELMYTAITKNPPLMYEPISIGNNPEYGSIGQDFLTWLWMSSETDGVLPEDVAVSLPGEIVMANSESEAGSKAVKIAKGIPSLSREATASLLCGKKVEKTKYQIEIKGAAYEASVDSNFIVKGLDNFEKYEDLDENSKFFQRIVACVSFYKGFEGLFKIFTSKQDQNKGLINYWVKNKVDGFRTS